MEKSHKQKIEEKIFPFSAKKNSVPPRDSSRPVESTTLKCVLVVLNWFKSIKKSIDSLIPSFRTRSDYA